MAYDDAAMGDSTVPVVLAQRVLAPVLTLARGASPAFLQYGAKALANAIPVASEADIEGQTHDVSAEALAPHLIAFFSNTLQVAG